jgi:hypothetical protein
VIDDLIQIRNTIRVSLGAARIDSMNTDVNAFLSAVREHELPAGTGADVLRGLQRG